MPLYLCVDCGGSKTSAVLANSTGDPVGRALGGSSNFAYLGLAPFIAVVKETIEKALRACDPDVLSAELSRRDLSKGALTLPPSAGRPYFAAAWLGVSGCDSAGAIATLAPALENLLGVRPRVANDTHLLAAPMMLYPDVSGAVAVVAGTGGIVVSFRERGTDGGDAVGLEELGRVGGWGWILGDEGGGFHVGREAIRQVLEEADRAGVQPKYHKTKGEHKREKTWGLKNRILQQFGVDDVYELLSIVHLPDPVPSAPGSATGTVSMPTTPLTPNTAADPPVPPTSPVNGISTSTSIARSVFGSTATSTSTSTATASPTATTTPTAATVVPSSVATPATVPSPKSYVPPREKRLASLSPLVFAAAFEDRDPLALRVLQATSSALVDQICILLRAEGATGAERTILASESILCLGGSLAALQTYRGLMLEALREKGHVFQHVQVVDDAAAMGAKALAVAARGQ